MGAPGSGMKSAEQPAAETLLTAFKTIDAKERRRHASVLNYWLSIRGDKEFPPLHDLDPLELSDAGPNSALLELISGGHDAEIRHLGEKLRDGDDWPERIMDADSPSILACIGKKLPIVAISRDFLAFEDHFEGVEGETRCWVTLLPLSAGGAWVDYVYALVSFETDGAKAAKAPPKKAKAPELEPEEVEEEVARIEGPVAEAEEPLAADVHEPEALVPDVEDLADDVPSEDEEPEAVTEPEFAAEEPEAAAEEETSVEKPGRQQQPEEPIQSAVAKAAPGFSKLLDSIAGLTGFYGSQPVKVEPLFETASEPVEESIVEEPAADESIAEEPVAEEPVAEEPVVEKLTVEEPTAKVPVAEQIDQPAPTDVERPTRSSEGSLQNKLTDVRAKTNEARLAKIRANAALYEGLGAAYDFALDAEDAPEEYLRLVEAQGLKIQLRAPMKPVVKLAFEGMCDDSTIKQLEAVLAWAIDQELPRGSLAGRIETAGGIGPILKGEAA